MILARTFSILLLAVAFVWPAALQQNTFTNSAGMEFILVPAGEFDMGRLRVKISKPFYLGKYEVTQEQWVAVMRLNPSHFNEAHHPDDWRSHPVEQISWIDAQKLIGRLSASDKGWRYRLPTEAEWEYAARAGGPAGKVMGWYLGNSGDATHPVGQQPPNAWGFYDMVGNVFEWCQDWYRSGLPGKGTVVDPTGPPKGDYRVVRGGSWCDGPEVLQLSYRFDNEPDFRGSCGGLRLAAEPAGP